MTNTAEESCTDSFQILNSTKKKKKKKRKRLDSEIRKHYVDTGFCSPLSSDHSSIFSWHFDDQGSEKSEALQKKSKKKASRERSGSQIGYSCITTENEQEDYSYATTENEQVDYSCVTTESERNHEAGTGVFKRKKKKKRKCIPSEQDESNPLCVPLRQQNADNQPETDHLEKGNLVDGRTSAQKKRAKALIEKQDEASKTTTKPTKNRTDRAGSNGHEEAGHGSPENSQVDLFTSSPLPLYQTQPLNLSREKATTQLALPVELDSSVAARKKRKHKKSSSTEDSDATDICFTEESATEHVRVKNRPVAKQLFAEDSHELPKTSKDARKWSPTDCSASPSFFIEDNELLEYNRLAMIDLDTATQELEEFIPHVRKLSPSAIRQLASRDLIRFKNFKRKGIAVKFGKFSKAENNQLRKNVEAFLQDSGIESAEKLLFTFRFPEERVAITKQKAQHLFGIKIAEGIPRPWRLVYYRARKMFDPKNYHGKYSKKEKRKLMKYQALYGNNWKKISELMSRSSHSIALKFSQTKCKSNYGPWSREETKKLIQAIKEILLANVAESSSPPEKEHANQALLVSRENLYKGIPWVKVEASVGTRNWRQCRKKWMSVVTKKMSAGQTMSEGIQSLQFKINLIERLYEVNADGADEVDWESLSDVIGDVPPDYIQKRFYKLKVSHVPFWNQKTFPEIIDHLYEVTLPKLKIFLKAEEKRVPAEEQSSQVKEQKKVFQFKDIFPESSEEEEEEEEEMTARSSRSGSARS